MGNKHLFTHYANMVIQDYDREFSMFKYLGMLTNPEGYREIERLNNPPTIEEILKGQISTDGDDATDRLEKENEKYDIKYELPEQSDEAIILG